MSVLTTFYRFLLRGGPTEKASIEVAKDRELLLDTTTKELRVGDGATPGGLPLTVGTPTADRHMANKAYVDAGLAGRALAQHGHTTDDVSEGSRLYYTDARADARISAHNTATDSHADLRTLIGGKQAAGDYLLASDTAANSAKLGGVAASNFPQYEENSWTPEITASVTAPTGVTYELRYGRYTKMGKTVFCRFGMRLSNKGSGGSGRIRIGNLPYVIASGGTGSWMANSTFMISIVNGLQPMQLGADRAYIEGFAITTTYDALTNTDYLIGEFFYHTT